jgi:hypothetical protein
MTKKTIRDWNPDRDLTALLDGLTEELLAASDHEIGAWARQESAKARTAVRAMRRLVKAAADSDLGAPRVSNFVVPGLPAHLTRNQ